MARALVIIHEPEGGPAEVGSALEARGFDLYRHVVTDDHDRPDLFNPFPDIEGFDLITALGSMRSLADREGIEAWIGDEIALVRDAHGAGIPFLGICFGGQLLAEALGGRVVRAERGELGWYDVEPIGDAPSEIFGGPWMQWHDDRFDPPPDAQILARTNDAVQAFRVGRSVGTQFHPEVTATHVAGWLDLTDEDYRRDHGIDPESMLDEIRRREPLNSQRCRRLVDWFLDDVARLDGHPSM